MKGNRIDPVKAAERNRIRLDCAIGELSEIALIGTDEEFKDAMWSIETARNSWKYWEKEARNEQQG